MGRAVVTLLAIDTESTRAAARHLASADEALGRVSLALATAAATAAFSDEHLGVAGTLGEMRSEAGTVARLFALTAERAETADSSYAAMIDGWLATSTDDLRRSINDADGTNVGWLLSVAGSNVTLQRAALQSLTPEAARAWFSGLPTALQLQVVATDEAAFDGTPLAGVIDDWKAGLDAGELNDLFTIRALDRAGIDPDQWDPALGLGHNAETIEAVYEYYADLYRGDTDRLWWSGMAALIGPSFYGGFQDLDTFAGLLDGAGTIAGGPLGIVVPGGFVSDQLAALGSRELADELEWYQLQLMRMQQEIFYDMAPAHEAYLDGGVEMVERFYAADSYDYRLETIEAWRQIDEGWRLGDQQLIADGNETLLRREQQYVILDDYDNMRARPITGVAVTYMMTAVGARSVPGASSYPEVLPLTLEVSQYVGTPRHVPEPPGLGWLPDVPLPHVGAEGTIFVETPLPDGNISVFDDRWELIQRDTLPVYVDLAANHPDQILDVLETPVGVRAEEFTFANRLDDLIADAVTNWDIDVDVELVVGW